MKELWKNGPKYKSGEFPLTTDSILLADFAPPGKAERVLDIGCGAGIIGLLLAWNNSKANVTGVEISEDAALCARENIAANGLSERMDVICADINSAPYERDTFDLVLCNPPYFAKDRGKQPNAFRGESTAELPDIIGAAARALHNGGSFCLVHRPERLPEIFVLVRAAGLEPKRLRFVAHTAQAKPSIMLIDARLGGGQSLEVLPLLELKDESGRDSREIRRICHLNEEDENA